MAGDLLPALQVQEHQLTGFGTHPYPATLVGHRCRVLVGPPREQPGLVHLAGLGGRLGRQGGRGEIGPELGLLVALETHLGRLAGGAVPTDVGDLVQPLPDMSLKVVPVIEDLAGKRVALDVLDPGLDLALALGVVALAGMDAEPGGGGVGGKGLVQFQLPILLVQYHQAGLVVDTLLGTTAEVVEGGIVQPDEGGGVDGSGREPDVHQARIRQDEDHEVHRGRLATEQHPSQLAAIDLALHPSILRVAPISVGSTPVSHGNREREVTVIGSTHDFFPIRHLKVTIDRPLPEIPPERQLNVTVLGAKLKHELFGNQHALGEWIRIGDRRYRVIGELEPAGESLGLDLGDMAVIPVASAQSLFDNPSLFRVLIQARSQQDIQTARKAARETIRHRHDGEDDVTIITQDAILDTFNRILRALTRIFHQKERQNLFNPL